jgi:hypothetical protein
VDRQPPNVLYGVECRATNSPGETADYIQDGRSWLAWNVRLGSWVLLCHGPVVASDRDLISLLKLNLRAGRPSVLLIRSCMRVVGPWLALTRLVCFVCELVDCVTCPVVAWPVLTCLSYIPWATVS